MLQQPLIVYDDAALALHLNASLSPLSPIGAGVSGEEIWQQQPSHHHYSHAQHSAAPPLISADDRDREIEATAALFQSQMAQYTRRIETLRSQLASVAGARNSAAAGGELDGGYVSGGGAVADHEDAGGGGEDNAEDEDDDEDDDDDPERYATAALSEGPSAAEEAQALAAATSSLPERRRALAAECARLLGGRDNLARVRDFLLKSGSGGGNVEPSVPLTAAEEARDERRKLAALTRLVGADKARHWKLVDQLLFLEGC
jgi:hypothetical protein